MPGNARERAGSSPHMRGTPLQQVIVNLPFGIIPAYAGNTDRSADSAHAPRDHPRICGEHSMRRAVAFACRGSSPHMRGTLTSRFAYSEAMGIIPAYAGNTHLAGLLVWGGGDHPRICGEHRMICSCNAFCSGSSPHMRGTPSSSSSSFSDSGIIPAYAGNTMVVSKVFFSAWDHPRICGEHGACLDKADCSLGSSPHMRGTRSHRSR